MKKLISILTIFIILSCAGSPTDSNNNNNNQNNNNGSNNIALKDRAGRYRLVDIINSVDFVLNKEGYVTLIISNMSGVLNSGTFYLAEPNDVKGIYQINFIGAGNNTINYELDFNRNKIRGLGVDLGDLNRISTEYRLMLKDRIGTYTAGKNTGGGLLTIKKNKDGNISMSSKTIRTRIIKEIDTFETNFYTNWTETDTYFTTDYILKHQFTSDGACIETIVTKSNDPFLSLSNQFIWRVNW